MSTTGSYEFKPATVAKNGFVVDALDLKPGEWAWYRIPSDHEFLAIYAGCPDCKLPMTFWRRFGQDSRGHAISPAGDVSPSVLHTYLVDGQEKCGFHTQPTKLIGFVDLR